MATVEPSYREVRNLPYGLSILPSKLSRIPRIRRSETRRLAYCFTAIVVTCPATSLAMLFIRMNTGT